MPFPAQPETACFPRDAVLLACRRELDQGFRTLRFGEDLEPDFRAALQATQFRALVGFMLLALVVLCVFAVWDLVRLSYVPGEPERTRFIHLVMAPRWAGIVLLALATWLVSSQRVQRLRVPVVMASMLGYAMVSFFASNVLSGMGIPFAPAVGMLIVMVVFYPCGLTFYQSLTVASVSWLVAMVLGAVMLPPAQQGAHVIHTVVMFFALSVAAMNGYLREHAMREQYLMRHVLDWDAGHDPLTQLANRRVFGERGTASLAQALRTGEPLALAIVDVDHFKAYNDRYGHAAGDSTLRQISSLLGALVRRPLDLAVRLGGEEFAILSYGEDAAQLGLRLHRMQQALRARAIAHGASPTAAWVTVSAGVGRAQPGDTLETLYRRADLLLYRAKAAGRDRVLIDGETGDGPATSMPAAGH